jgi:hypothetical protein
VFVQVLLIHAQELINLTVHKSQMQPQNGDQVSEAKREKYFSWKLA